MTFQVQSLYSLEYNESIKAQRPKRPNLWLHPPPSGWARAGLLIPPTGLVDIGKKLVRLNKVKALSGQIAKRQALA